MKGSKFCVVALIAVRLAGQEDPERRDFLAPHRVGTEDPAKAQLQAFAQIRAQQEFLAARGGRLRGASVAVGGPWAELGPKNLKGKVGTQSGRITALVLDPRDTNRVYLGTANGGLYRSVNGGASWIAAGTDWPFSAVGAIGLDPRNPDVVYVALGDSEGDAVIDGFYRSADRGANWESLPSPLPGVALSVRCLVVHPASGDVYACVQRIGFGAPGNGGLYRYRDGAWSGALLGSGVTDRVAIPPGNSQVVYATRATFRGDAGIYKSTDGGDTWTPANGSGSGSIVATELRQAGRLELAMAPSAPDTLYLAVAPGPTATLYKTTNGGASWEKLAAPQGYCGSQCVYNNSIAVHPTNPDILFVAGVWMYRSGDGGKTFVYAYSALNSGSYVDHHALVFSPDGRSLWVGNDGGVYLFEDTVTMPLRTARGLNAGLSLMLSRGQIAIPEDNPSLTIVGTQDMYVQRYAGSTNWDYSVVNFRGTGCGDGGNAAFDPYGSRTVYVTCFTRDLLKSMDGGLNWESGRANIPPTDRVYGNPPIVFDPNRRGVIYYGTYRVWMSRDGGASYEAISPELTPQRPNSPVGALTSLAVSGNVLYAGGSRGELWRCENPGPGAQWQSIVGEGWAQNLVSVIADPRDPNHAVAAVTGFVAKHVFETRDGGKTWDDISGNLPALPVLSLAFDSGEPGAVYAGTWLGVFTTRGGHYWEVLGEGLPRISVTSLAMHRASRTLRAGTYGRGLWEVRIPSVPGACRYEMEASEYEVSAEEQLFTIPVHAGEGCGYAVEGAVPEWAELVSEVVGFGESLIAFQLRANETGEARTFLFTGAGQRLTVRQRAAE